MARQKKGALTREELGTWRPRANGLHMEALQDGKRVPLVLLADVVRWLREGGPDGVVLPEREAIERVIARMDADVLEVLYAATEGDYAQLVHPEGVDSPPVDFEKFSPYYYRLPSDLPRWERRVLACKNRLRSEWIGSYAAGGRGIEGFESRIVRAPELWPNAYAIPTVKAAALWGWGAAPAAVANSAPCVVLAVADLRTFADLVAYRQANPLASWGGGQQYAILRAEVERRGGTGAKGAVGGVAAELGISPRAVNQHLQAGAAVPKEAPNELPGASVFSLGRRA